ncbi:RND family efflux transporter, MFP subunit [Tangfeifania diversioriginum]|uniref:RND family efflux transporter, MFP subunit n=1 Tax=Tangfeifania diversioriginum TaxID=1168035 RepID=A0A1M6A7U0_9BACT|nr:efflux RND transporter periplasmic adaptor subunit [Tangfeifania diversioriginum]SHI32489.1 RND family efflux transporter, MFP subunit [Tangfeifania diversioriginum]
MKRLRNNTFLLFCLVLLAGCAGNNNGQTEIIRKIKIEPVQQSDSLVVRTYSGMVNEANQVNLAFRVAGPIQKILVKEGDYVRTGQVVAQMDTRDYEVQLAAALAQYEQVKAEADRVIELHNRESVAGNDYDKAVSGLKRVEAQLKNAKDQLNDTKLTAPVSGYIQQVNFLENELVDAGMPVASLIDVGHYQVEVEIPVALYVDRENITSFSGLQPAVTAGEFPLQLLSYSRKANNNQLYKVQLRLNPASQPKLAPGMDIQVNIVRKNPAGAQSCVPLNALFNDGGKTYVWVYQANGRVQKREVVTGQLTGDGRIRISGGLNVNEQVVVAGVNQLNENEQVKPLEPVAETNVGGLL